MIVNRLVLAIVLGAFQTTLLLAQNEPATVQLRNEEAINTESLEFSPTFFEDGILFITTNTALGKKEIIDGTQKLMMSLSQSRRTPDGTLGVAESFSRELYSRNHEGPVCFDRTAETIYFSSNAVEKGKDQFAKDNQQKTKLYFAKKSAAGWTAPEPIPFNNNEFDDFHPAINIDGDKLFFASNRPGGFGSTDLYVSYKVGESWSEPVNLGPEVNTSGREAFPFIHADHTLYYASDGIAGGLGKFDIYYVLPENNKWTKPVNIGAPFNTAGDDFGLIVDLNKINGYLNSNGMTGKGGDDIYSFHVDGGNLDDFLLANKRAPDRLFDLKIAVTDRLGNGAVTAAAVQILNYDINNVIGRDDEGNLIVLQTIDGKEVMTVMPPDKGINGETDQQGSFRTQVKPGNYVVIVTHPAFQTKQYRVQITKSGNELSAQMERPAGPTNSGKVQWTPSLFNYLTNAPLSGVVLVVTNTKTGKQDTLVANANGMVDHQLDANARYSVKFFQGGKLIGTTDVDTHGLKPGQPLTQNISLAPLLPGAKIDLPNIYYNFNDATLRPDARKDLDLLIALMKQQPDIVVELASHTDCRGNAKYNQELSQKRAEGVLEYMAAKGIGRNRMKAVGFGESEPRNKCVDGVPCTDQEHGKNRRTEVRIPTNSQGGTPVFVNDQATDPTQVSTIPSGKVTVTTARADNYYVISGSFLMETRAYNHMKNLRSVGFGEANVVQFPNSTFFSVAVGKFGTRKEAIALEKKLAAENFESFIRAVQQQ